MRVLASHVLTTYNGDTFLILTNLVMINAVQEWLNKAI